jgi:hypothetical protein
MTYLLELLNSDLGYRMAAALGAQLPPTEQGSVSAVRIKYQMTNERVIVIGAGYVGKDGSMSWMEEGDVHDYGLLSGLEFASFRTEDADVETAVRAMKSSLIGKVDGIEAVIHSGNSAQILNG